MVAGEKTLAVVPPREHAPHRHQGQRHFLRHRLHLCPDFFYRNAINIGLAILECDEAAKGWSVPAMR